MLGKLKALLAAPGPGPAVDPEALLRRCLVALLVETARADFEEHPEEAAAILSLVRHHFRLGEAQARDLVDEARAAVDGSVSLHEFTAPLHQALSYAGKLELIGMLWAVALRDHSLDKYEEYLVGKLADLLYVARGDVVRLRWQALQSIGDGREPEPPGP